MDKYMILQAEKERDQYMSKL